VVASLPAPPVLPLQAALGEIRRQRERIEHARASSTDVLTAAVAIRNVGGQSSLRGSGRRDLP
jgi:hypothetical protein